MTDTKPELNACCAHLRVRYRTVEQGSGCVSGHWECEYCFTEFTQMCHTRTNATVEKTVLEDADKYTAPNQELFDLIKDQTGKVLVQSELNDIINLVLRLNKEPVINDMALAEAVKKASHPGHRIRFLMHPDDLPILESLINHAVKGENCLLETAARNLCDKLIEQGFGQTSETALPAEFDNLLKIIDGAAS